MAFPDLGQNSAKTKDKRHSPFQGMPCLDLGFSVIDHLREGDAEA